MGIRAAPGKVGGLHTALESALARGGSPAGLEVDTPVGLEVDILAGAEVDIPVRGVQSKAAARVARSTT